MVRRIRRRNHSASEKEEGMAETYKGNAYCMKCKEKRPIEGTVSVNDKGRRTAKGTCPQCGTKVNIFLPKA
jgi:Zn finger protein HypA/HybF involved in hydrogenase expression